LFPRIIVVADAFDSLTTSQSHREALGRTAKPTASRTRSAELRRRVGSQFDPSIVAVLERSLAGRAWEPTPWPLRDQSILPDLPIVGVFFVAILIGELFRISCPTVAMRRG
jgi:hypothetical protein